MGRAVVAVVVALLVASVAASGAMAAPAVGGGEAALIVSAPPRAASQALAALDRTAPVAATQNLGAGLTKITVPAAAAQQALRRLNADPRIDYAERDAPVHAAAHGTGTADPDWGTSHTGIDVLWPTTTGDAGTVVAVLDTGVDVGHPDFAGARFTAGYDFVNDDANPADDNGHGTAAAGIIAMQHNAIGGRGACPGCAIMPIKVLDAAGSGGQADVAAGIRYAADNGADIINLSLGGSASTLTLQRAVEEVSAAGVLVVAAAGNEGVDSVVYPGAYPDVIAVAASNPTDDRYPWSNWGPWVSLAAPGCNLAPALGGGYNTSFCGTSSAAPLVAGHAGLLASVGQPSLTTVRQALESSALPVSYAAKGRIRGPQSLTALDELSPPTVALTAPAPGWVRGTVAVRATASDNIRVATVALSAGTTSLATLAAPPYEATLDTTTLPDGPVTLTAAATDDAGTTRSASVETTVDNTAPAVTVTAPGEGAELASATTLTAAVVDAAVDSVQFSVDGTVVGTDTEAPYSVPFHTAGVDEGAHTLTVTAVDVAGNSATASRGFTVAAPLKAGTAGGRCQEDPERLAFTDVKASNFHTASVACVVELGVARGTSASTYGPAGDVTREQMATFIVNAITTADATLPKGRDAFGDDDGSLHAAAINRLAAAGIVRGVTATRYAPTQVVTREQMATFLVRAYAYVAGQDLTAGADAFADDDASAHHDSINAAAAEGLATGTGPSTYDPTGPVRRDQMATFVVRLLDRLGRT